MPYAIARLHRPHLAPLWYLIDGSGKAIHRKPHRTRKAAIAHLKALYANVRDLEFSQFENGIKIANSTSRGRGAVGEKAIAPKIVSQIARKSDRILDFGAGKYAQHANALRRRGFNVTAHEFGDNQNWRHDPNALTRRYDIVLVSNVLNVQSTIPMLRKTLAQIKNAIAPGGFAIANYPASPRKLGLSAQNMLRTLQRSFQVRSVATDVDVWLLS